jgi:hypothetical protein
LYRDIILVILFAPEVCANLKSIGNLAEMALSHRQGVLRNNKNTSFNQHQRSFSLRVQGYSSCAISTAQIIDGKKVAEEIRKEIAAEVQKLKAEHGMTPGLGKFVSQGGVQS